MTGLTAHLARTLVHDRQRSAERHRVVRSAVDEVVRAAATGDEHAWAQLQDRYGARVRAVARRHRLGPHDVDDVAQTTWLRLFENIGDLRDASAVGAWLETTARRESLALLRLGRRECPTEPERLVETPSEPVAERRLVAAERRTALASALELLPRRQRHLLHMMLVEPTRSYDEIAASLEMPIGSIGPTRARSLARLRRDRRLARAIDGDPVRRFGGSA